MTDPFKLFTNVFIASFKIFGYSIVFIAQVLWYIVNLKRDKIGEAFGNFGHAVVDAIAEIFK
jgi:hypothetical protein